MSGLARALLASLVLAVACGGSEEPEATRADAAGGAGFGGFGGFGALGGSGGSAGSAGSAGAAAASVSAGATGGASSISASGLSVLETETAVTTAGSGFVVATWIGIESGGNSHNGYAFSVDGGATWAPPQKLDAPGGRVASDPVVFASPQDDVYLTFIGFKRDANGQPFDMRVYLAKAAAGATSFGTPVDLSGATAFDSVDKPWGVVGPDGTIYVTWLDTGEPRMRVAVSQDAAQSFTVYDIDDGQGFRNLIYPCVDAVTGRVHVVYHPGGGIGHRFSDDKGKTWPSAVAVALPSDEPAMFDDPTCAAHGGTLWVAYGVGTDGFSPSDSPRSNRLRIAISSDGGQNFATYVFGEDSAAGTKFLHPQLVRTTSGELWLLYYAGSDANPDPAGSLRVARSSDGGKTFAPSAAVKAPITFKTARGDPAWLGDYIGLHARSSQIFTTFADNSAGFSHIVFRLDPG